MKSIFAKATLGACMLALPAALQAGAAEPVRSYDDAALTLKELIRQAEQNISQADALIEARKIAERNAARDAEARKAYERGSQLAASGDMEGARAEWKKALEITRSPEMKSYIAEQTRKAEEKAAAERAALRARIDGLNREGIALFDREDLEASLAKFREVRGLDSSDMTARQYIDSRIPAKKEELRQRAAREQQAKGMLEKGDALLASGDIRAAVVQWRDALKLTVDPSLSATLNTQISSGEESIAKAETVKNEGIALFEADSLDAAAAKFRDALAVDPMQPASMNYLEVQVPARRLELKRLAEAEEKARGIVEKGDGLYAAGNLDGAQAAWREALAITRNPELKAAIASKSRKAEEKAAVERAALQARIKGVQQEGESLFGQDRLDEALAKFNEVLALEPANWAALQYVESRIPERRAELRRIAAAEEKAAEAVGRGDKLFAASDLAGARSAYEEAVALAEKPSSRDAAMAKIRQVVDRERREAAELKARVDGLQAEGVALYGQDRLDDALVKFREVLSLDASHSGAASHIDVQIPARRAELQRIAAAEQKAAEAAGRGDKLFAAGVLGGAKAAYEEAARIAEKPASKDAAAAKIRQIEALERQKAAELKARVDSLQAEGVALFGQDQFDGAVARFREVLSLDASHLDAADYINTRIPARKAELQRRAEAEKQAKGLFEGGVKLYASGDLHGSISQWNEALSVTEDPELTAALNAKLREAEARVARVQGLFDSGVSLFDADSMDAAEGKFREAISLDPMHSGSMEYLEVRIPAQRAELKRRAEVAAKVKASLAAGTKLYDAGDMPGAISAWDGGLRIAETPGQKAALADRIRMAEERQRQDAAAREVRLAGLYAEGTALYDDGRLDEADAKFREVLSLDSGHYAARQYISSRIPERKAELQRKAEAEAAAKAAFDRGNKLYAEGDFEGAKAAWKEALQITERKR